MEETRHGGRGIREQLLLAGIDDINQNGIQNFSVRRVANACGVSCAAPYTHFEDKPAFLAAIVDYIDSLWKERKEKVLKKYPTGSRRQLAEVSLEYVRFLVENPHFRSIIMGKDDEFDLRRGRSRGQVSDLTQGLIQDYCRSTGMSEQTRRLKTYVVRSLIYGAALMFDNGELDYNDENMALVAYAIEREFDLA